MDHGNDTTDEPGWECPDGKDIFEHAGYGMCAQRDARPAITVRITADTIRDGKQLIAIALRSCESRADVPEAEAGARTAADGDRTEGGESVARESEPEIAIPPRSCGDDDARTTRCEPESEDDHGDDDDDNMADTENEPDGAERDNGEAATRRMQIAVCVDVSGSMSMDMRLARVQTALASVARSLPSGFQLHLLSFSGAVTELIDGVTSDRPNAVRRFIDAAKGMKPAGNTDIGTAVQRAIRVLTAHASPNVSNRVWLLSDGKPTVGLTQPDEIVAATVGEIARSGLPGGCAVDTFGIGYSYDAKLMAALADVTGGRHHTTAASGAIPEGIARAFAALAGGNPAGAGPIADVRVFVAPLLPGCELRACGSCEGCAKPLDPRDRRLPLALSVRVPDMLFPDDTRTAFLMLDASAIPPPAASCPSVRTSGEGDARAIFAWEVRYRRLGATSADDSEVRSTGVHAYPETRDRPSSGPRGGARDDSNDVESPHSFVPEKVDARAEDLEGWYVAALDVPIRYLRGRGHYERGRAELVELVRNLRELAGWKGLADHPRIADLLQRADKWLEEDASAESPTASEDSATMTTVQWRHTQLVSDAFLPPRGH